MVIKITSAVDINIHAVSPELRTGSIYVSSIKSLVQVYFSFN
jgi:hypothetical protein